MYNCTLTGNDASYGGGAYQSTLTNCIVFYNTTLSDANYDFYAVLNYCCTAPLPNDGVGNLDVEPGLASAYHLSANSPCLGKGTSTSVTGVDFDGEPWANPPAIGCDQYSSGSLTGALTAVLTASPTNVVTGFSVQFQAFISGKASVSLWDFGDGTVSSNRLQVSHSWSSAGDYQVVLRTYNETHPAGVSAKVIVHVQPQPVHYVAAGNPTPVPPYISWATAATNIQDAVDAVQIPGALVLVTNGVYGHGGRSIYGLMTNRVALDKLLTLRSVNGPQFTIIQGYQVPGTANGDAAVRCVYLTNGATLSGFTLTGGATRTNGIDYLEQHGGGAWCEVSAVLTNCILTDNSAYYLGGAAFNGTLNNCDLSNNAARYGGGAYGGILDTCMLAGNWASSGGGASESTLSNCTLAGNWARLGGGVEGGTLDNCTLDGNWATNGGGGASGGILNHCTLTNNSAYYGGGALYRPSDQLHDHG